MAVPSQDIEACRAAHVRLSASVHDLSVVALAAPSRLPGWSVAHVLTHLARNADSVVRRLEGARQGRLVQQYAGGKARRAEEIASGAARTPETIKRDVVRTSEEVDQAFENCPADLWDAPILLGSGEKRPASQLVESRWREVEIHHVDLGLSYGHSDWDDAFVTRFLPNVLQSLSSRADATALLAWGLGRGDAPLLAPWG